MSGRRLAIPCAIAYGLGAVVQFWNAGFFIINHSERFNLTDAATVPVAFTCSIISSPLWPLSLAYMIHLEKKWKKRRD